MLGASLRIATTFTYNNIYSNITLILNSTKPGKLIRGV
jgi:hypothetical protein